MYLHETLNKSEIEEDEFIDVLLSVEQLDKVEKCEVWCSSFDDPGEDFCEYRFFNLSSPYPFLTKKQEGI